MNKKTKILEFFEENEEVQTDFTDNFTYSFILNLMHMEKDITSEMITEWIKVVSDIIEIFNPKFTHDLNIYNNLLSLLKELKDERN